LGGPRGGEELDVGALGRGRRAGRAAVDPGRAYGGDEVAVEPRIAGGDGAVTTFLIEQHNHDSATGATRALAEIRHGRSAVETGLQPIQALINP
jgi:hypothetical protein